MRPSGRVGACTAGRLAFSHGARPPAVKSGHTVKDSRFRVLCCFSGLISVRSCCALVNMTTLASSPPPLPPELISYMFFTLSDIRRLAAGATVCRTWQELAALRRDQLRLLRYKGEGFSEAINLQRGRGANQHHHCGASTVLPLPGRPLLVCEDGRLHFLDGGGTSTFPWKRIPFRLRGSTGPAGMTYEPSLSSPAHHVATVYISDAGTDIIHVVSLEFSPVGNNSITSELQHCWSPASTDPTHFTHPVAAGVQYGLGPGELSGPGSLELCGDACAHPALRILSRA